MNKEHFGLAKLAAAEPLINYIKLKSRLSVRLRHGIISVVSAWIDLGLGLCLAEVFEM